MIEDTARFKSSVAVLAWQIGDAVITAAFVAVALALALALYRLYLRRYAE